MKILVIEDEPKTAAFLKKGLSEHGYVVDTVFNGEDGLHQAQSSPYDLIILDAMMPKLDGWTVIERLRQTDCHTMTLFLTARDSLADRVRGLDAGADAYIAKPFSFLELLTQIRALSRRAPARSNGTIQIADLEIDLMKHMVSRSERKLDLTPKEFSLMALFARRKDEVLSRALIADQVWDMHFDSDTNVVDVHVARLRLKVDAPFEKKLIHTVRGVGYVLRDPAEEKP